MAKVVEKEVYRLDELCKMLGSNNAEQMEMLKELNTGQFPLPSLRLRRTWYFPKATVDKFLKGYVYLDNNPSLQDLKNSKTIKKNPARLAKISFDLSKELNNKFNRVCANINMELDKPLNKGDFLRVAIEEFVERRPEYGGDEIG